MLQVQGAQILCDDLYLAYHEATKDAALRRIWTFYEAIKIKSMIRIKRSISTFPVRPGENIVAFLSDLVGETPTRKSDYPDRQKYPFCGNLIKILFF